MSCIKPVAQTDVPPYRAEAKDDLLCILKKKKELKKAANRIFGNGWSHSITNCTIDFIDHDGTNYLASCSTTVKVQLANGIYHEDCGCSRIEASTKELSIEKARMTSIMNALINALWWFDETEGEMKQFYPTLNISNVAKTKFALKRPISPPPPGAQSTPKITKNTTALFEKTQLKKTTNTTPVVSNGSKIPESHDKVRDKLEIENAFDLDVIFTDSIPINTHSASNVPTTVSAGTSVTLTEEEMRLERKRKQREKQEEFKRQMKDKEEKEKRTSEIQKPNSKF